MAAGKDVELPKGKRADWSIYQICARWRRGHAWCGSSLRTSGAATSWETVAELTQNRYNPRYEHLQIYWIW